MFSCIIPASKKDAESQNLKDLIASIKAQDFPKDQIEILVITEGDSESAKAIGIRRAQGEICVMLCADNFIYVKNTFERVAFYFQMDKQLTGVYPRHYLANKKDNSLNRYFSLMGSNDPVCWFLGKNDRLPHYSTTDAPIEFEAINFHNRRSPSLGCNGFFYRREHLVQSDLEHYYPMDNAADLISKGLSLFYRCMNIDVWHRTSDNLFTFLRKRYRYAKQLYCDRDDRRWKIVDTKEDKFRLALFIASTLAVIPALLISIRGYSKLRDWAWFWHWPVSFGFLITYTVLAIRNLFKHGRLFQCRLAA